MKNNDQDRELVDPSGKPLSRRQLIVAAAGVATTALIAAKTYPFVTGDGAEPLMRFGDRMSRRIQRAIMPSNALAREFGAHHLTSVFPTNGGFGAAYVQADPSYDAASSNGFRDWRLIVDGAVERPSSFTLDDLRAMPQRTQITLHTCDQGWSAIGQWSGVPLKWLLTHVGIRERGQYVVLSCMDRLIGSDQHMYNALERNDAFHPQTILAHDMNGKPLPKRHGAPLRLRAELLIGYKQAKHINRISVVEAIDKIGRGFGGTWEDLGFQSYAGM